MSYTLTFSNLLGEFVTDKELLGAQDPYVIFEAGGKKSHTKAIKNAGAGTVEWKETYTLHEFAPKSSSILEVTVYNHNTLRPDGTLGSGTVNLSNLGESQLSGSGDRVNVSLTDKKGKNVGTLKFTIHGGGFTGTGRSGTTGSGYGTGTGAGVGAAGAGAAGAGYGSSGTGTGTGSGYGTGSGTTGTGTGQVTGVGAGSNYGTAKAAADKAAHENRDVTIQNSGGTAAGRPTNIGGTGYDESSRSATTGAHTSQTGTHTGVRGATTGQNVQPGEVIDRKYYTGFEDRPQEQALVEQYREHNPYAKQYETTVQHTGRERLVGSSIEALGTTERVVGTDHHVSGQPHDHIARALPKGAVAERPGGEGWVQGKSGPVCDSSTFEVTGDRTVDKERVTNLREHREFEKEFEVKTALTGERQLDRGAATEQLNRERVLLDEKNKIACEGHPTVDATTGGSAARGPTVTGGHTGTGSGITGSHHTGSGITGGHTGTGSGITGGHTGTGSGITGGHSGTGSGITGGHTGTGIGSGSHTGTGIGSGSHTGTGSGITGGHTGTGSGITGSHTGTGHTGTGSGITGGHTGTGSGVTGGHTGTGTTGSGYGSGTTGQNPTAGMSTTQKIAALVPGTEANKEKKAAQGSTTY